MNRLRRLRGHLHLAIHGDDYKVLEEERGKERKSSARQRIAGWMMQSSILPSEEGDDGVKFGYHLVSDAFSQVPGAHWFAPSPLAHEPP